MTTEKKKKKTHVMSNLLVNQPLRPPLVRIITILIITVVATVRFRHI